MPTYEYKCPDGHECSETRGITEDATLTECPECEKPVIRIFSAPPIIFNGSGFSQKRG